jgi:hypothetical protein
MHALPDDSRLRTIRPRPSPVTAEEYEALPEEIARAIEIVDGHVVYREAPTRRGSSERPQRARWA